MPDAPRRGILWGLLAGWGSTVVGALSGVILTTLAVRALPDQLSGTWLVLLNIGWLSALLDFGVGLTVSREVAYAVERRDDDRLARLRATAGRYFLWLAAAALPLGWAAIEFGLVRPLPGEWQDASRVAGLVFLLGAVVVLENLGTQAILVGYGQYARERAFRSIGILAGLAVSWALLGHLGILGLSLGFLVQALVTRVLAGLALRRLAGPVRARFDADLARSLLGPSVNAGLTALGGFMILNTGNFVLVGTLGAQAVPNYALLARVVTLASTFPLVIASSVLPFAARAHAAGRADVVRDVLERTARGGVALMLMEAAFILAWIHPLLDLWVGPNRYAGLAVLLPLLVAMVLEVHHVVHATILSATGRVPFARWAIGAGALTVALSVALTRLVGVPGVALGTMIAQLLTNNWYVPLRTLRDLHLHLGGYARAVLAPLLVYGAAVAALAWAVREATLALPGPLWQLGVGFAVYVPAAALLGLLCLAPERRALLARVRRAA